MKTETRSFYEVAVERAVARIVTALDEALDLGALAREAALSPFHFHRIFRGMIGETPVEMHRRLRLERAAERLCRGDAAVVTIAFDAGYETHEAFTRAFRRAYGVSPTAFRQDRPDQLALATKSGVHFDAVTHALDQLHFLQGDTPMNVTVEQLPARRVATVSHMGAYARINEAFARLGAIAGPAGLLELAPGSMIALYHDDPESTPVDQLRSDAGLIVPDERPLPKSLGEQRLPAGRYAHTLHRGPYDRLGDTWARLMGDWLPKSGHRVGEGATYERYLNHPGNAAPEDLETELYLPLA